MAVERLAIQLLGDFRVSVGARATDEREWTSRKVKSLVKLLALAPHHRLHREHVIDRLLMHLLAQSGRRHLVLWQYQVLRAGLQQELHVEPVASLQALYQDIRDRRGR